MAAPTTWWICDNCGQRIQFVEHAFVEWLQRWNSNHQPECRGLRMVHDLYHAPGGNGACMYPARTVMNAGWSHCTCRPSDWRGQNGAKEISGLIRDGFVPAEESWEIYRRININGYEQARLYFNRAIAERVILQRADNRYTAEEIDAVLRCFGQG